MAEQTWQERALDSLRLQVAELKQENQRLQGLVRSLQTENKDLVQAVKDLNEDLESQRLERYD